MVAIYPALLALVGCHPSPKPATTLAPIVQTAYVDYQGTLQWLPTGKPFEIYWTGISPCDKTEAHVVSTGKTVATCHTFGAGTYGGSYPYYVDKPGLASSKTHKGVDYMHVGSCGNCPGTPFPPGNNPGSSQSQVSASPIAVDTGDPVEVSCAKTGDATTVDPSTGPSGLKVGNTVTFEFSGDNPPPSQTPLTITFQPGYCTNLKSNQIVGTAGSYQISSAGITAYKATTYNCSTNTTPTLTAN
jgi:hypothetical protein